MELDDQVCYCFHVSMRKLVNFTRQTKPVKASQLSECFGAGTGCGWCVPFLKRIHENVTEEKGDVESTFGMTAGEYARRRKVFRGEGDDGSGEGKGKEKNSEKKK